MPSKDVRNAIIALIVLLLGIRVLQAVAGSYYVEAVPGTEAALQSLNGLVDVIVLGLVVLALILVPVYFYVRHGEK